MTRFSSRRLGAAILIGLGLAAIAEAQPQRSLDARLDQITQPLDLSSDQETALDAVAQQYGREDSWAAAAAVHDILTADQISQLRQTAEQRRSQRRARAGEGRQMRRGARRAGPRRGQTQRVGRMSRALSDEQRASVREIRRDLRQQRETLIADLREGNVSDEVFQSRMRQLRDAAETRMLDVVPAGAATRMREARARRDAAKSAREQALGLTASQKAQIAGLRVDRVRQAPERLDLRPYLDDDGQLDRQALREAQRGQREMRRERAQAHREAVANVLSAEQREIIALHRALSGPRQQGRRARQR
ncbi:MAG: hypothetical protein AAGK21_01265 [Bacteroidota bacterium]